jgi:hypothetical protein
MAFLIVSVQAYYLALKPENHAMYEFCRVDQGHCPLSPSQVGSRTGAVAFRLRLQSPPRQTRRAVFRHRAFLPASHQGL